MPPTSRIRPTRAAAATGLIIAGLLLAALYRIVSSSEHHSFSAGPVAPNTAHVTQGKQYTLSTPGGVKRLKQHGIEVTTPQCEWSVGGSASQALTVTAAGEFTKASNVVATFVAPFTGDLHFDCLGWGPMYVDNADNASADIAGWSLLLAVIMLTAGVALGLAALRSAGVESERATREDDEIERLVHAVHVRSTDEEVVDPDGGDVRP
jgi:hypothetical protein